MGTDCLQFKFPRLFSLSSDKDGSLKDFIARKISSSNWNLSFRRPLLAWEDDATHNLQVVLGDGPPLRHGMENSMRWKASSQGASLLSSITAIEHHCRSTIEALPPVSSISHTNPPPNLGISASATQPLSSTTPSKLAGQIARIATIFRIDEGFAKATCNFTTLIGQGAFGLVYKDQMLTSETIVVKMLATDSKQEAKEFQTELAEAAKAQFSHDYSDHLALMRAGKKLKETSLDMNTAGRILFLLNQ
ncbi:uncharacterized protein LOC114271986 [Camellia sinensis]|uniref:uncharacterized protein LOC114271986 n=1 Tax=Camellia sinensis TaxID=4442 RepID=UPI0010363B18|nr:uncharacterized protein LOC114271986 [Camellia sinensis]